MPGNRRASDFRNIQGDSAIRWNTVRNRTCYSRVSWVAGEEGEGSHPSRGATQQRGCQPQRIDQGPTRGNYRFSSVVLCFRRESVTTGEDPGREGNPRRGKEEDEVRCQLDCSSTVEADLTRGKREKEGSTENQEVRTRRTETRSRFFERRPYRLNNSGESAIPESRATRATTLLIAQKKQPYVDDRARVADRANR